MVWGEISQRLARHLGWQPQRWPRGDSYLCPVGGMNGLLAKLAITELRAQVGTCSGSSSTYACFKDWLPPGARSVRIPPTWPTTVTACCV